MRVPGWRALGLFWAVVLAGAGGTAVWLHRMGPPGAATLAAATPPLPDPALAAGAGPGASVPGGPPGIPVPAEPARDANATPSAPTLDPPAAAPVAAPPPPAAPAPVVAAAPPPAAPEPPPLPTPAAPRREAARRIPPPDPALLETTRHGMVPRLGPEGRTSIRAYGRDFDRRDSRPRVAVVVADIGLSATQTEEAIRRLPPQVALALSPYAARPAQAAERARERGMETLISIPMEPAGYPLNDPGDRALLTGRPMAENLDLLDWALSRAQGYVGAIGAVGGMRGERFAALEGSIGPVQEVLLGRGLLYLDPRPGAPPPARAWGRSVDVLLDEPAGTGGEIDRRLAELERIARDRGGALGLAGAASPVVVERLAAWAAGLDDRGLVLAPVSAMIRRPEGVAPEAAPIRPAVAR
ncbi:divergent polysaccharide deacetylase family protein [Roseomonas sp. HF4]|uniref:divergent polysaccharide deacetylase family protein n=1 Tax=Roseomonas sp. HF4 TaxID=2562313 RepID=UPI0010C1068A|nr:divergent polysaccharide deacetylase family protein [Roseomonas sp. HF4]